eukprot:6177078-Pyramimonas_sp.AAC.1
MSRFKGPPEVRAPFRYPLPENSVQRPLQCDPQRAQFVLPLSPKESDWSPGAHVCSEPVYSKC